MAEAITPETVPLTAEPDPEAVNPALAKLEAQSSVEGVLVTNSAAGRIRVLLSKDDIPVAEGGLRLGVIGGGCSGHSYSMRLETKPRETDRVFEFDGARVFIDPKSFVFLKGMTLDYEETLIRQGFNFINPNATKSCGCGTSFST